MPESPKTRTRTIFPLVDTARRVLVVDDEPGILRTLTRALGGAGVQVETAGSGREALDKIEGFSPEVVISDYRLTPEMDGVALLEEVRKRQPETQRILMTGVADVQTVGAAIERGRIVRLLTKPWTEAMLLAAVHGALVQYDLERENRRLIQLTQRQNRELSELNRTLEERIAQRTETLQRVKRQWELTFDAIDEPLMIIARDYRIVRANRAMARDLGRPVTELSGRRCHELRARSAEPFAREDGSPCRGCPVVGALAGRAEPPRELRGPGRHYRIAAFPMPSEHGAEEYLACAYSDVTQERAMIAKVAHTEKMAALGRLAAKVAHEINNPLGGILAFAQILRRAVEDPQANEDLGEIERNALRCKQIVQDLLRFGRMAQPEERRRTDVNDVVADALRLLAPSFRQRGIRVEQEIAPDLRPVEGNPNQLTQVLVNLLQNALDASNEGAAIRVATANADGGVRVDVQDHGCGIPEAILGKIFDPDFTTKPEGSGTGLGLAVSYGIVRDHSGSISVESKVGSGSTFSVLLPAAS